MGRSIKPTQPVIPRLEEYVREISSIWDCGIMTNNGAKVDKFKQMLLEYTKCGNIDLFVNGHSALMIALKVLGLQGEVITSPFTFVSTTNAVVQNGLTPVFGDIDASYNLSPESIEKLMTDKTCAVITPHIFGIPCDVDKIGRIAEKYNLKVIYDGAQAFGTRINGTDISCFGDITMFSFHAIKIFNSIEGGMLSYKDSSLHGKFEQYRNFGISYGTDGRDDVECEGINAKMNEFQAAMGIVNLPFLQEEIARRKELAGVYIEQLREIPGISTYPYQEGIDYNYAYFPILVEEEFGMSRDWLWEGLREGGIGSRKLYGSLTCDYSVYRDRGFRRITENADKIKKKCLDLPLYGSLTKEDVEGICQVIGKLAKKVKGRGELWH